MVGTHEGQQALVQGQTRAGAPLLTNSPSPPAPAHQAPQTVADTDAALTRSPSGRIASVIAQAGQLPVVLGVRIQLRPSWWPRLRPHGLRRLQIPALRRCCSGRCCSGRCCSGRCCSGRCCSGRCCSGPLQQALFQGQLGGAPLLLWPLLLWPLLLWPLLLWPLLLWPLLLWPLLLWPLLLWPLLLWPLLLWPLLLWPLLL